MFIEIFFDNKWNGFILTNNDINPKYNIEFRKLWN